MEKKLEKKQRKSEEH